MPGLKNAFKRQAKLQSESVTRHKMHWRHKEDDYDVVSSVLHEKWGNATHPDEHDAFNTTTVGDGDGITRYSPENPGEWETFHTEETHMPRIVDKVAYRQFVTAFRHDVEYLNAEAAAEFLHGTFEADFEIQGDPYNDCNSCGGTGRICDADACRTYCYSNCGDDDEKLRVSDAGCSCTSCNTREHWTECDNCGGTGSILNDGYTRTFPYSRDKILSEMPSKKELQVLQFTLNKMANIAEEKDSGVSVRKVIQLFDTVENSDADALIDIAVSYVEPAVGTVEVPEKNDAGNIVTDDTGSPVMTEKVDEAQIEQTRTKLGSADGQSASQQAA